MIELISRRTGMADTRTSRKRVAAALMPVLQKAGTIDMKGAVQAAERRLRQPPLEPLTTTGSSHAQDHTPACDPAYPAPAKAKSPAGKAGLLAAESASSEI